MEKIKTILDGWIQARECELIRSCVICQSGNGEDVITGQLVNKMCDLRNISGLSASFLTGHWVNDIGR